MSVASQAAPALVEAGRRVKHLWIWLLPLLGLLTPDPLLTTVGIAALPLLAALLWQSWGPPVLLLAVLNQWLQVFVPVLRAAGEGQVIGEDGGIPELRLAAWLGVLTVVVLAIGMRLGTFRGGSVRTDLPAAWYVKVRVGRLTAAYLGALGFSFALPVIGALAPSVRQVLLALGGLRWVLVFLVIWIAIQRRDARPLAIGVLLLETLVGLGGYFSGFKAVYYLAAVAMLATRGTSTRLVWTGAIGVGAVALILSAYWQAIKGDYRFFLSQGERSQAVVMPLEDRYRFLVSATEALGVTDLQRGLDTGLDRLGYIEFLARALQTVPAQVPHQGGQLWGEALEHVVMPRFLFPGKGAINDSDRTNAYCGVRVADASEGTSISIGYAGESYIDFGPILMFLPILLLGIFWGWGYRWLSDCAPERPLGIAAGVVFVLSGALLFETSNIKLIGGGVTSLVVWTVMLKLGARPLWRFLTGGGTS